MIYGYARCSTDDSRQDIDRQRRDLRAMGADDRHIYWEYGHGAKRDRPELSKLLAVVSEGDTICATEVSRLTRSTGHLCELMETAREKHLRFQIGTLVLDCTGSHPNPMTVAMLEIIGVFAELEREMISERVRSGMANAKAKGRHIGRPKLSADTVPAAYLRYHARLVAGELSVSEVARLIGVSRPTVRRYRDVIIGSSKNPS